MILSSIKIENFKNYETAEISFLPGVICFTGPNGAGKTNMLDAIYYLCTGKSSINSIDQQLIRDDADYFSLKGEFETDKGAETVLCVLIKGRKKVIKRNDEPYTRLIDHYGEFPVVMVAPGDIELIQGGSEERRKWLDSVISSVNHDYLLNLLKYDKILQQRNAELRKMETGDSKPSLDLIKVYDSMIIPVAEDIFKTRTGFIADYMPYFETFYHQISGKNEEISLTYLSELQKNNLGLLLAGSIQKDLLLQRTNVGTHKDDLDFQIHGKPLKKFGSQGQQKTFLLALKLAQLQFIKTIKGQTPILLLDDVCERLDEHRLSILFRLIQEKEGSGQVFVTDTSAERVSGFMEKDTEMKIFKVEKGKLEAN